MIHQLLGLMVAATMATTSVNLGDFLVISHRGLPSEAPAHTFEGYDLALEQGSLYIEQDLFLSRDGHLIVSHDNDLGAGNWITEMTLEEIKELRVENGEPYYTLADIFERYGKTVNYVIENKMTEETFSLEKCMVELILEYDLEENVILQSFHADSLRYFKDQLPFVPCVLLVGGMRNVDVLNNPEQYECADILALESHMLNKSNVNDLRETGVRVYAYFYVEKKKEMKRIMGLGLDGIFTDYTGRTFDLLKKFQNKNQLDSSS